MAPVAARSAGAVGVGTAIFISLVAAYIFCDRRCNPSKKKKKKSKNGIIDAIGNTPLIRINSLSDATGCEVINPFFNFLSFFLSVTLIFIVFFSFYNSVIYCLDSW